MSVLNKCMSEQQWCAAHAALGRCQGLEGSRKDKLDRYGDMARLGGTSGHLVREVPPSGLDKLPVTVPLLPMERSVVSPTTTSDMSLGEILPLMNP